MATMTQPLPTAPAYAASASELLSRWDGYLWVLAKRYTRLLCDRSAAADLHSEIALLALRYYPRFDPSRGAFCTWLKQLALAAASQQSSDRKQSVRAVSMSLPIASGEDVTTISETVPDPRADTDVVTAIAAKERDAAVRAAVAALPDAEREAVTTRFWTDGVLPSGQRPALASGLQRLRGTLVPPDRDDE